MAQDLLAAMDNRQKKMLNCRRINIRDIDAVYMAHKIKTFFSAFEPVVLYRAVAWDASGNVVRTRQDCFSRSAAISMVQDMINDMTTGDEYEI